jgi:TPR repeat protein
MQDKRPPLPSGVPQKSALPPNDADHAIFMQMEENMPELIELEHIDAIARKMGRGVLYVEFPKCLSLFRVFYKPPARRAALRRLAAERGNMSAQYALGLTYCKGDHVKQDYTQAAHCFQRASVNPEPSPHYYCYNEPGWPQSELAHLYREGKGVERDPAWAVHWYETSLYDANYCSELALAMAYECGYGVEADIEKARFLYSCVDSMRKGADELAAFFLELMDDAAAETVE